MDISSSGESPSVVAAQTCETSATYCVSTRTERVLLCRTRDANSRIVNIYNTIDISALYYPRSTMKPERGNSKSERLRKRKAVTPHRPAKRPRLFQANQQETELRQRRTFRKWRHNFAVYYAANLHGSCVNSAKSAQKVGQLLLGNSSRRFLLGSHRLSFTAADYRRCRHQTKTRMTNTFVQRQQGETPDLSIIP